MKVKLENLPKISYLISCYPAISHTFILKEILHLKSRGLRVNTASINVADRPDQGLTDEERIEQSKTFYIKDQGVKGALKSIAYCLKSRPLDLFRSFFYTFKLSGTDLKQWVYSLFYFVEACIVVQWMDKNNSRHLHVHFGSEVATVGLIVKKVLQCIKIPAGRENYDCRQDFLH